MQSYKLIIAYDGTRYFGWQKTKTGPSIQESLEQAILKISREQALPEAASRTDRGVHARGQVVQFNLEKAIAPSRLSTSLNAVLPPDIRVLKAEIVLEKFHPTLDAIEKEYRYLICLSSAQEPFERLYSWHRPGPLDIAKMEAASKDLLGTHDFSAFANEREKDPVCTLSCLEIVPLEGQVQVKIRGNRFLYKMVRNLVGTLVYIGCGKLPTDCIPSLFASKDRKKAGVTAPAHGLYLHHVFYNSFANIEGSDVELILNPSYV